jgi:hypothetical protein
MKKLIQLFLLLAIVAFAINTHAQKKIKTGVVKFELTDLGTDAPEAAMMQGSTMDFYFSKNMNRMDMSMLGGMMRVQTIIPNNNLKEASILMDMMGQKFQIVDMSEEELSTGNNMLGIGDGGKVSYDKSDTKTIAGYKCHKASMSLPTGAEVVYYVTEKICPPDAMSNRTFKGLKGFPMEMIIDTGQGFTMTFRVTDAQKGVSDDVFKIPSGYKKMTMEEFSEQMGGMNFNFGN